jgi:hypothetical protein
MQAFKRSLLHITSTYQSQKSLDDVLQCMRGLGLIAATSLNRLDKDYSTFL